MGIENPLKTPWMWMSMRFSLGVSEESDLSGRSSSSNIPGRTNGYIEFNIDTICNANARDTGLINHPPFDPIGSPEYKRGFELNLSHIHLP